MDMAAAARHARLPAHPAPHSLCFDAENDALMLATEDPPALVRVERDGRVEQQAALPSKPAGVCIRDSGGVVLAMATSGSSGGGLYVLQGGAPPRLFCDVLGDGGPAAAHDPEAAAAITGRRLQCELTVTVPDAAGRLWLGTRSKLTPPSDAPPPGELFCVEGARKMVDGAFVMCGVANDVHEVGAVSHIAGIAFASDSIFVADAPTKTVRKFAFHQRMATLESPATLSLSVPVSALAVDVSNNLYVALDDNTVHRSAPPHETAQHLLSLPMKAIRAMEFGGKTLYVTGIDDENKGVVLAVDLGQDITGAPMAACALG